MSTPLIALTVVPRRPSTGIVRPARAAWTSRGPLYIDSQTALIRRGSWPTSAGPSSWSTVATIAAHAPALPTAALASPHPIEPSSHSTSISAMSKLATRPKSETC
jgi:hypothetical protein